MCDVAKGDSEWCQKLKTINILVTAGSSGRFTDRHNYFWVSNWEQWLEKKLALSQSHKARSDANESTKTVTS